jgi:hypothetical protein
MNWTPLWIAVAVVVGAIILLLSAFEFKMHLVEKKRSDNYVGWREKFKGDKK